jgi:hypothetical protein
MAERKHEEICPECGCKFSTGDMTEIKEVADTLLRRYCGGAPNLGEVLRLQDKLEDLLIKEFNGKKGLF